MVENSDLMRFKEALAGRTTREIDRSTLKILGMLAHRNPSVVAKWLCQTNAVFPLDIVPNLLGRLAQVVRTSSVARENRGNAFPNGTFARLLETIADSVRREARNQKKFAGKSLKPKGYVEGV